MELATIFLIWLAITVIDNLAKRRKRRLPPPESPPDFDIPTIQGDPNFPGEELPIFIESPRQAEVRPRNLTPPSRPKKFSPQEVQRAQEANELDLTLTPANVMQAFILSEVLDKPKALRRRRF
ncbi:MAG: hypothetical protein IJG33_06780 [Selenomonadaceae bacterium]|nr:hypothetical protein [Selenomonadaceae bacterium]